MALTGEICKTCGRPLRGFPSNAANYRWKDQDQPWSPWHGHWADTTEALTSAMVQWEENALLGQLCEWRYV